MFMNAIIDCLLYFLSFPPYDFLYLIFPALYLFYYSLLSSEKSFLVGFVFGCVAYGVILFGIESIGLEAWIPLTILMGLMYGIFSKLFSYLNTKSENNFYVLLNNVSPVSNAPLNVMFVCLVELIVAVNNVLAQVLPL